MGGTEQSQEEMATESPPEPSELVPAHHCLTTSKFHPSLPSLQCLTPFLALEASRVCRSFFSQLPFTPLGTCRISAPQSHGSQS